MDMRTAIPERKVLLAVREGYIDPRMLTAARALSQRMDAGLDILVLAAGDTLPTALAEFVRTLCDDCVAYTLTQVPSLRRRDIVNYANTHKCVSTVVIDSLEGWERVAADKASNPWQQLTCPLVTATSAKARPSTHD